MLKNLKNRLKQIAIITLLILVVGVQPAHAQLKTLSTIDADIPGEIRDFADDVADTLFAAGLSALVNGVSYFLNKIAYETAVFVASGGNGQDSLIYQEGWGEMFTQAGQAAVGDAIGAFGEGIGLNLCSIPDIDIQVFIMINLEARFNNLAEPRCSWQELRDNWTAEEFERKYGPGGGLFVDRAFNDFLRTQPGDFEIALGAISEIEGRRSAAEEAAILTREEGQGFQPLTDLISGDIVTPAQTIQTETETVTAKYKGELNAGQIAGIYGSASAQILPMAGSVFLNTLLSQLLDKTFSKGLIPSRGGGSGGVSDYYADTLRQNKEKAERAFNFLLTTSPAQLNVYDISAEFAACPTKNPGLNNCVMDSGLQRAIQRANSGDAITIKEALSSEVGLLHSEWPLIPPTREADNANVRDCYLNKYCYSNIQKLRKARILPLGFEVAALRSDPDRPWTLGEVVDNYENCARDSVTQEPYLDDSHPFCHLIDPNWIILVPETKCEASVYGPELVNQNSPTRRSECVDISTCIAKDAQGGCADYGYCTREENAWQLPGEACEAQYATCKIYQNTDTGDNGSYLSRTLDFGQCNAESVGCRAYSTEGSGDSWISSGQASPSSDLREVGRNQIIHFNQNILEATCSANADGCSLFLAATNTLGYKTGDEIYLKKAPDYLGCYDTDTDSVELNWPESKAELQLLSDNPRCDNYSYACIEEEVGCDLYTPISGPTVPANIGANSCDAECAGYDTYRQEATAFTPDVMYREFIPAIAKNKMEQSGLVCTEQYTGCSEFTNLDTASQGGEGLEYFYFLRQCERPEQNNGKTFYTWEGSVREGYVLRVHELVNVNTAISYSPALSGDYTSGSPVYADRRQTAVQDNLNACNKDSYDLLIDNPEDPDAADPDCRAFFDDLGNTYYRLLSQTVTVSSACHALRKTDTSLDNIAGVSTALCTEIGGTPQDGEICQLCVGGGRYESGSCIYQTISEEGGSNSCPAVASGCFAYIGNTGNNVTQIIYDTFEPFGGLDLVSAKEGWSSGVVVSEATQVGLHSLYKEGGGAVEREIGRQFMGTSEENDSFYELTFWARGSSQALRVEMDEGTIGSDRTASEQVSVSEDWREYKIGPIEYGVGANATGTIRFGGTATYYLDNVRVTKIRSKEYLIKDSWQVGVFLPDGTTAVSDAPLVCDSEPRDGLPGEALGCRAYTNSLGRAVYTTGFESICREKAAGCQPVVDSYNTKERVATLYNVWCERDNINDVTTEEPCSVISAGVTDPLGECTILVGEEGCYVEKIVLPNETDALSTFLTSNSANVNDATIVLPADAPYTSPIYLTNTPRSQCGSYQLGCTNLALEEQILPNETAVSYNFVETYLLNNPAKYGETLCPSDLEGCGEFKTDTSVSYFKDPLLNAGKLCVYRNGLDTESFVTDRGWFLDGIGKCNAESGNTGEYCRSTSDCSGDNLEKACDSVGDIQCYPTYFDNSNAYGIFSNSSDSYQDFVGTCPADANLCTEFVDRQDTSKNPNGEPYYAVFDDKVKDRIGECNGKVSLREGCVLFDKTENPRLRYDAGQTYAMSEAQIKSSNDVSQSLVQPMTTGTLDSNIILKVDRDRECSEWLACKNSVTYKDESGQPFELCYQYQPCNESQDGRCVNFVGTDDDPSLHYLDQQVYISRNTSWYGQDYAGYSLFEHYPIGDYVYLSFGGESDQTYVVRQMDQRFFEFIEDAVTGEVISPGYPEADCRATDDSIEPNWKVCGLDAGGRCYGGACVYPIDGAFSDNFHEYDPSTPDAEGPTIEDINSELETGSCKAYPEDSSPYPQTVLNMDPQPVVFGSYRNDLSSKKQAFQGANVCQDAGNCSCEYQKVSFESGAVDYYSKDVITTPDGICIGGKDTDGRSQNGKPCDPDGSITQCGASGGNGSIGTCSNVESRQTRIGTLGYCLERDLSRPINGGAQFACLTWLPIQISASGLDLYNSDQSTGYLPSEDADGGFGQVYCQNSTRTGGGEYDQNRMQASYYDSSDDMLEVEDVTNMLSRAMSEDNNRFSYNAVWPSYDADDYDHEDNSGRNCNDRANGYLGGTCWSTEINKIDKLYTVMQAWAWGWGREGNDVNIPLILNRTLLRLETRHLESGGEGYYDYGGTKYVSSLLPDYFPGSTVEKGSNAIHDTGVFFHPGRFDNSLGERNLSFFLPGDLTQYGPINIDHVVRFNTEASIREEDIKAVYFTATGFFDGAVGRNPSLGQGLEIDFGDLSRENKVYTFSTGQTNLWSDPDWDNFEFEILPPQSQDGNRMHGSGFYYYVENPTDFQNTNDQINRDYVARRYVLVWDGTANENGGYEESDDGLSDYFAVSGAELDKNPFETSCSLTGRYGDNWFAIGMDFNSSGEFLGYISRFCHGAGFKDIEHDDDCEGDDWGDDYCGDSESNGIRLAVVAELNDHCTEVAQVYDEIPDNAKDPTNKAWTDRVWARTNASEQRHPVIRYGGDPTDYDPAGFLFLDQQRQPFGSLPLVGSDVEGVISNSPSTYSEIRKNIFVDESWGLPFACRGSWLEGSLIL
ncbi:hypothetical protein KJ641_03095, partial [Patescibacteria group bacterium]|nr:hypothetical protein [Patescibacteria group bacterium]